MFRSAWLVPFVSVVALVVGCSRPAYVKTAYYGDLATLKSQIRSAQQSRTLDRSRVLSLAEAVAKREVFAAEGDVALERIREARSCIDAVEPELRARSEATDDVAAESLLALVEADRVGRGSLVDKYRASPSGAFRAVAARVTVKERHAELRRTFIVDPDERVRRAALRAAFEAKDPGDRAVLLETARLDPDGRSRSLAARAIGAIGGTGTALALRDLWAAADPTVRLSIVEAWGMKPVFDDGGATELLRVAEEASSLASVAAAAELARIGRAGAAEGTALLEHTVLEGTTDERLVALQLVSLSSPTAVTAVEHAATSEDATVRVVALARLLDEPKHKASAQAELTKVAAGEDTAARQARAALSLVGDAAVAPLLVRGLQGKDASFREQAALGLFRLGRAADMASTLADSDPSVRMSVACSVLADAHRG